MDATLVDAKGLEMKMPTDFDDFTVAAAMNYRGKDPVIAHNLDLLHWAMARGGFIGMRTEWWHFIGKHWRACKAVQVDSMLPEKDGKWNAKDAASTAEAQQGGKIPAAEIRRFHRGKDEQTPRGSARWILAGARSVRSE